MALSLACCPACHSFCCVVVLVVLIDVALPLAPAAAPAAAASSVVRSAKTHCRSGGFSYCKYGFVFPSFFINRYRMVQVQDTIHSVKYSTQESENGISCEQLLNEP